MDNFRVLPCKNPECRRVAARLFEVQTEISALHEHLDGDYYWQQQTLEQHKGIDLSTFENGKRDLERCNDSLSDTLQKLYASETAAKLQRDKSQVLECAMRLEINDLKAQNLVHQHELAQVITLMAQKDQQMISITKKRDVACAELEDMHAVYALARKESEDLASSIAEQQSHAWELEKQKADLVDEIHRLRDTISHYDTSDVKPAALLSGEISSSELSNKHLDDCCKARVLEEELTDFESQSGSFSGSDVADILETRSDGRDVGCVKQYAEGTRTPQDVSMLSLRCEYSVHPEDAQSGYTLRDGAGRISKDPETKSQENNNYPRGGFAGDSGDLSTNHVDSWTSVMRQQNAIEQCTSQQDVTISVQDYRLSPQAPIQSSLATGPSSGHEGYDGCAIERSDRKLSPPGTEVASIREAEQAIEGLHFAIVKRAQDRWAGAQKCASLRHLYGYMFQRCTVNIVAIIFATAFSYLDGQSHECWTKLLLKDRSRLFAPPVELFVRSTQTSAMPKAAPGDSILLKAFSVCTDKRGTPFLANCDRGIKSVWSICSKENDYQIAASSFEPTSVEMAEMQELGRWWNSETRR